MNNKRRVMALLLALLLLPSLALPTAAQEIRPPSSAEGSQEEQQVPGSQEGPVPADSEPVYSEDGLTWITESMAYDPTQQEFVYPVGDTGTYVRASVASGMIVTKPVRLNGATLLVYRNGEAWEGDFTNISQPGEYVVLAQVGSQTPRILTFTLAGSASSTVYSYNLPSGMLVLNATRDGQEADFDRGSVLMQEDGVYHVEYQCLATGAAYSLDLTVDRTPPELQFSGKIDENNRVHSALRFSGLQPDDTLRVTLDGSAVDVTVNADGSGELTQSGSYIIRVYDAAGNLREYGYTVMLYLNAGGLAFFVLLAGALLALGIYILIKRKRLEIG